MRHKELTDFIARTRRRSLRFLLWKVNERVIRQLRRGTYRHEAQIISREQIKKWFNGSSNLQTYLCERSTCLFFSGIDDADDVIKFLSSKRHDYQNDVLSSANKVCNNTINILTHGETFLGAEIDWSTDYSSGFKWESAYFPDIDFLDLGRASDVRVVWELNRLHFLVDLGKAYRITHDDRYVQKLEELIKSWCMSNPVGYSVNWIFAMEVAIRAINIIWAFELCLSSGVLDEDFITDLLQTLIIHGRFIFRNLEYNDLASNHYIADFVGLVYLGLYLNEYPEARKWLRRGMEGLESEMRKQVYEDGVDYEKSLSYHRLVTEMFLSTTLLLQRNNLSLSSAFMERLERMLEFVQAYICPDGSCPIIGDNDDGRLHWLGSQSIADHRYLLSTGAVLFQRSDFKDTSGRLWEESAWLLGTDGIIAFQDDIALPSAVKSRGSVAFPFGGFFVMRQSDAHLIVDCGDVGRHGQGGHGHNDVLSFTLALCGERLLVDSGCPKYTADWEARRLAVGTRAHNLLMLDHTEIAEYLEFGFGSVDDTPAQLEKWSSDESQDRFVGEHRGYQRLTSPVTQRRSIVLDKKKLRFSFTDDLFGLGRHQLEFFFHFDPMLHVTINGTCFHCVSSGTEHHFVVEMMTPGEFRLECQSVYQRYGIGTRAWTGIAAYSLELPVSIRFEIYEYNESSNSFDLE
jgi:hypothetical protein